MQVKLSVNHLKILNSVLTLLAEKKQISRQDIIKHSGVDKSQLSRFILNRYKLTLKKD